MKNDVSVSVVMCVRNVEKHIAACIRALLDQPFRDFEIVIVDDSSNDNTRRIIKKFDDERIRLFANEKWLGIAKSRNKGLEMANGNYIFFTDGDCTVSMDWIERGLESFKDPECVGVEGKICYGLEEYEPTLSDYVGENLTGGQYMTGNMAYRRSVIERVEGFDERYCYLEDRDLALRVLKHGRIRFNPNMIVYAQQAPLTPKKLIQTATRIKSRVLLFKRFGERRHMLWRIVYPQNLAKVLFPPLVFLSPFFNKVKKLKDFQLLPFLYVHAIYERLQLWKECAIERVFLI